MAHPAILSKRYEPELVQRFEDAIHETRSTFHASFSIGTRVRLLTRAPYTV